MDKGFDIISWCNKNEATSFFAVTFNGNSAVLRTGSSFVDSWKGTIYATYTY